MNYYVLLYKCIIEKSEKYFIKNIAFIFYSEFSAMDAITYIRESEKYCGRIAESKTFQYSITRLFNLTPYN